MAGPAIFPDGIRVLGILQVPDTANLPVIPRSKLIQESLTEFPIPWESFRVHDAYQTSLPGTPLADDLGLVGGTFGTGTPTLQTEDLKAEAGNPTLNRARFTVTLPESYIAGETVEIHVHAGMLTTVADDAATVDVEAFIDDEEGAVSGADICATAAQGINSLVLATKVFSITPTSLLPGTRLDVRITTSVSDGATATVVKAVIGKVSLHCDTKG